MNSYISSFKAVFTALIVIVAIEMTCAAVWPASPAERSDYLNWNFNSSDPRHKIFINEKLKNATADRPDIIQVGDSSGLHGIIPRVVEQYLGGLKYENLSCCANSGFDGYYSMAQFMLRHDPGLKAVVLYITLNNLPRRLDDSESLIVGGQERLRSAFGSGAALTTLPTLATREEVVRWVYTQGGNLFQWGLQKADEQMPELVDSFRATKGWRPEGDIHTVPEKHAEAMKELCSASGIRGMVPTPRYYTTDIQGVQRTYTDVELRRFAALTAQHHAKLIVIFQPHPCAGIEGTLLPMLEDDLAKIKASYPNVIVPNSKVFESWPSEFSSADHARIGNEDALSRRAGRLIAAALGISYSEPPPPSIGPSRSIISIPGAGLQSWQSEGVTLEVVSDSSGRMTEIAGAGLHLIKKEIPTLAGKTYTATLTFTNTSKRNVFFQFYPLKWPGDSGRFICNSADGVVSRVLSVIDADIVNLSNGQYRCSGTFKMLKADSVLMIGLTPDEVTQPYTGDGHSSVVLNRFDLTEVPNRD